MLTWWLASVVLVVAVAAPVARRQLTRDARRDNRMSRALVLYLGRGETNLRAANAAFAALGVSAKEAGEQLAKLVQALQPYVGRHRGPAS